MWMSGSYSALQRDLELVEHLDRLGYDEAWIGEHHSAGSEIIASPEIFIAAAAERTRHIKLGTGVISLAYHNPLWVAERMVLLDHLTRGRAMLGVGPGSLPTDSAMIGLNPTDTRELLDVEPRHRHAAAARRRAGHRRDARRTSSIDARLHLRPYSDPHFDVAVAAVASPTGPRLAGRHGVGLLSIGATLTEAGFDALAHHWNVMEERAATFGTTVDRDKWRLVGLDAHRRDARAGLPRRRVRHRAVVPLLPEGRGVPADGGRGRRRARDDRLRQHVRASARSARSTTRGAQVEKLVNQSGGFGAMLLLAHEWANPEATRRSYELIAQHVMPRVPGPGAVDAGRQGAGDRRRATGMRRAAERRRSRT